MVIIIKNYYVVSNVKYKMTTVVSNLYKSPDVMYFSVEDVINEMYTVFGEGLNICIAHPDDYAEMDIANYAWRLSDIAKLVVTPIYSINGENSDIVNIAILINDPYKMPNIKDRIARLEQAIDNIRLEINNISEKED